VKSRAPLRTESATRATLSDLSGQCSFANTRFRKPDKSEFRTAEIVIDITRIPSKQGLVWQLSCLSLH